MNWRVFGYAVALTEVSTGWLNDPIRGFTSSIHSWIGMRMTSCRDPAKNTILLLTSTQLSINTSLPS
jgi:hypothetical protein